MFESTFVSIRSQYPVRMPHVSRPFSPRHRAAESLYDMVGLDIFSTEARVGNMASEVVLDSVTKDLPDVCIDGVPPLLVINVQLPSAPPALMTSAEDGPGFQVSHVLARCFKESTQRSACRGCHLHQ